MDRFLSPKQVRFVTGVSERQQGRLIRDERFPKPIPLYEGCRRIAFLESEISQWVADGVDFDMIIKTLQLEEARPHGSA